MDIVATLKERADSYDQSGPSAAHTAELLRRAATEIERLQAKAEGEFYRGKCIGMAEVARSANINLD